MEKWIPLSHRGSGGKFIFNLTLHQNMKNNSGNSLLDNEGLFTQKRFSLKNKYANKQNTGCRVIYSARAGSWVFSENKPFSRISRVSQCSTESIWNCTQSNIELLSLLLPLISLFLGVFISVHVHPPLCSGPKPWYCPWRLFQNPTPYSPVSVTPARFNCKYA